MQLAAHVVDRSVVLILLINVLLVGQQQVKQPRVELLVHEEYVAVLDIPLCEHVEVKQGSLSQEVVALADKVHEQFKSRWLLDLVVVINHQLRVQVTHGSV